ncbi:hypothetical protein ACFOM9_14330, partial [Luteimonas notoginsengisoli]
MLPVPTHGEGIPLHAPDSTVHHARRRASRRLLPLAAALFATGLMGGILIMVDASGNADAPSAHLAASASRALPGAQAVPLQSMAATPAPALVAPHAAGRAMPVTAALAARRHRASTAPQAAAEPAADAPRVFGLSWPSWMSPVEHRAPVVKANAASRIARLLGDRPIGAALAVQQPDAGAPVATPPHATVRDSAPGTSGMSGATRVGLSPNLSYIDTHSQTYTSFKSWVDSAVNGNRGYGFAASEAAIMFQITGNQNYCTLALAMVEEQVVDAEAAIAGGGRPAV